MRSFDFTDMFAGIHQYDSSGCVFALVVKRNFDICQVGAYSVRRRLNPLPIGAHGVRRLPQPCTWSFWDVRMLINKGIVRLSTADHKCCRFRELLLDDAINRHVLRLQNGFQTFGISESFELSVF